MQASLNPLHENLRTPIFFPADWNGLWLSLPLPPSHAIFTKSAYSEYAPGFRGMLLLSQSSFS